MAEFSDERFWTGLKDQVSACESLERFIRYLESDQRKTWQSIIAVILKKLSLLLFSSNKTIKKLTLTCFSTIYKSQTGKLAISFDSLEVLFSNFANDFESCVAAHALDQLVELWNTKKKVGNSAIYNSIREKIKDLSEDIRLSAVPAVFAMAQYTPETLLDDGMVLKDSAFALFCELVFDSQVSVQIAACTYLCKFPPVSESLLLQSLSKRAIQTHVVRSKRRNAAHSDNLLKRKKPAKTSKNNETSAAVQAARGDIEIDVGVEGLLEASYYGALTEALENEHEQVRGATVEALGHLSLQSTENVCQKSLPFLYEMFHDEMTSVRIKSVRTVYQIVERSRTVVSDDDTASVILSVLLDRVPLVRWHTLRILRHIRYATEQLLRTAQNELFQACYRHPEDLYAIFCCLRYIGRNHAVFIERAVPGMFNADPRFLTQQKNVELLDHQLNLVLAFGAAETRSQIINALPKYTFEHQRYLCEKYPRAFASPKNATFVFAKDQKLSYGNVLSMLALEKVDGSWYNLTQLALLDVYGAFLDLYPPERLATSLDLSACCMIIQLRIVLEQLKRAPAEKTAAYTLLLCSCTCLSSAPFLVPEMPLKSTAAELWYLLIVISLAVIIGEAHVLYSELRGYILDNFWIKNSTLCADFLRSLEKNSLTQFIEKLVALFISEDFEISDRSKPLQVQVVNPRSLAQDMLKVFESAKPKAQGDGSVDDGEDGKKFDLKFPVVDTGKTLQFKGGFPMLLPIEAEIQNVPCELLQTPWLESVSLRLHRPGLPYWFSPAIPKRHFSQDSEKENSNTLRILTKLPLHEEPASDPFSIELAICSHIGLPPKIAQHVIKQLPKSSALATDSFWKSFAVLQLQKSSNFGVFVPIHKKFEALILKNTVWLCKLSQQAPLNDGNYFKSDHSSIKLSIWPK